VIKTWNGLENGLANGMEETKPEKIFSHRNSLYSHWKRSNIKQTSKWCALAAIYPRQAPVLNKKALVCTCDSEFVC